MEEDFRIAIGAAWIGMLFNLAAGAFLLIPRPFKVGDFIGTSGVVGTVHEIGMLVISPAPDVEILEFNPHGPVLAVRPYCHTDHYWQVYFDTNKLIRDSFGEAGCPVPMQGVMVQNV